MVSELEVGLLLCAGKTGVSNVLISKMYWNVSGVKSTNPILCSGCYHPPDPVKAICGNTFLTPVNLYCRLSLMPKISLQVI